MTLKRILEDDELGTPASSERPGPRRAAGMALAAIVRHRVLLGSFGITMVALLAWRWTVRDETTPVAPSAGLNATTGPERQLEITVLGVHDIVAATTPAPPPEPPVAVPVPAAPAPASPPLAAVSSRPVAASRPAPARAQGSSATKATSRPLAAAKSVPADESRSEIAPVKPQPQPDSPPLETNPYVYK